MTTAITTSSFVNSLGINTHIDSYAYGYQNLSTVEAAINYLGFKNIRDSASNGGDASTWLQVAQATGAKFDDFIGETSPSGMQTELGYIQQLASEGILNFVEGGNEEDDAYPESLGNNQWITAQFQQQVYALGQSLGLPVINMSFGAGWTAANNWQGDYGTVGDLSGYTNYANAHTYPGVGQTPDFSIQTLNNDAHLAASSRPVITTEMGWDTNTFSQGSVAPYIVQAAFDAMKDGDAKTYFYALFNDGSGAFGLMNSDGSPTPAGTALHNLTSLLADTGANAASFTPGSLNFSLSGAQSGDNTLLMQKSNGSDWIALWDDSAGTHSVTVNLGSTASQILVFDPVTGTSSIASANNTNSITVNLGNDPLLIEVIPAGGTTSTSSTTPSTTSTTPTSTTTTSTTPTTTTASTSNGMSVSAPASIQDIAGQNVAIPGVQITDAYAMNNADPITATITDHTGTLSLVNAWGNPQQGSGATGITLTGTIWQVNAGLSNIKYNGSGGDSISIKVSDSVGNSATQTITVGSGITQTSTTGSGSSTSTSTTTTTTTPTTTTTSTQPVTQIAATDSSPVITASNITINASSGDHMIFIGGTGDTLTATGGTETVMAYQGGNTITTGAGNDTIRIAGSGSTINAGAGNNLIADSGSNNTIVLPGANQGNDNIYGWVMQNGDKFDLRSLLATTSWNGSTATIGNFVQVNMSSNNAIIAVDPSGVAGGASYNVATLNTSGNLTLSTLLAHAIT